MYFVVGKPGGFEGNRIVSKSPGWFYLKGLSSVDAGVEDVYVFHLRSSFVGMCECKYTYYSYSFVHASKRM